MKSISIKINELCIGNIKNTQLVWLFILIMEKITTR